MLTNEYWDWMSEQLKQPERAIGGEPCIICGNPIPAKATWQYRDRHVCSSKCNNTLKRRWKRSIEKGEADGYHPSEEYLEKIRREASREPRVFRTEETENGFCLDCGRFPIIGDVIERFGQHTKYMSLSDLPDCGSALAEMIGVQNKPPGQAIGVMHIESGTWTCLLTDELGVPRRVLPSGIVVEGEFVSYLPGLSGSFTVRTSENEVLDIYCNLESIRCVDDQNEPYDWIAISFGPYKMNDTFWTQRFAQRSTRR